jgi:hypothetical protein
MDKETSDFYDEVVERWIDDNRIIVLLRVRSNYNLMGQL